MVGFGVARDPTRAMWKNLKRALPTRVGKTGDAFEYVHLHNLPDRWNPNLGVAVVVSDDASQVQESSHDRVLVRVSVHAPDFDTARKWGRRLHSYLLSSLGAMGLGISQSRSTGVIVAPDSLAGGFVATATYSCGISKLFIA